MKITKRTGTLILAATIRILMIFSPLVWQQLTTLSLSIKTFPHLGHENPEGVICFLFDYNTRATIK